MLSDSHVEELHDFPITDECFSNVNIRGGLCYFRWNGDRNDAQTTKVITHLNGLQTVSERALKTKDIDIFIRYGQAISILEKIFAGAEANLSEHVSAAKAFGLRTFFINDSKFHQSKQGLKKPIVCYARGGKIGYVEQEDVLSHQDWIGKWKVYVPEANNIGTELNDDNLNAFVGAPKTVCTETFLVVGAEIGLDEKSAGNLAGYLKTRFSRFLLSLAKISQHGTSKTFRFVPVQDFTQEWTDAKLYAKYGITKEEQNFIESMIKPME